MFANILNYPFKYEHHKRLWSKINCGVPMLVIKKFKKFKKRGKNGIKQLENNGPIVHWWEKSRFGEKLSSPTKIVLTIGQITTISRLSENNSCFLMPIINNKASFKIEIKFSGIYTYFNLIFSCELNSRYLFIIILFIIVFTEINHKYILNIRI